MNKNKRILLTIICVVTCVSGCCAYYYATFHKAKSFDESLVENIQELPPFVETVTVYVCGEVKSPNLYTMPLGSRISDAIERAGGPTERADLEKTDSLAQKLEDGQKIYVPDIDDDIDKIAYMKDNSYAGASRKSKNPDISVNINEAGVNELALIPGIGEKTAETIIDYREQNGAFSTKEGIKMVSGIGEKTYESIKNNITIE